MVNRTLHARVAATPVTQVVCTVVEVDLSGPSRRSMFCHLGSLAERHGIRVYRNEPARVTAETDRLLVVVPRAQTQREAEEVVATLLERSRTWCLTVDCLDADA